MCLLTGSGSCCVTACCPQRYRDVPGSCEKPFIVVVVSSLAALIKDQVTFQQRIVRAAKVGDAKEVAEVAKDKRRKLTAGVPQP